jgi:hypothetical protein
MISFNGYKKGTLEFMDVVKKLKEVIPIEELFAHSHQQIAYRALTEFNFRNLENTEASVAKYAQKLLDVTGLLKNVDQPIYYFLAVYLDLGRNLLQVKYGLEMQAKKHLKEIDDLLNHYHTLTFIIKYRIEPQTPRNNEERKNLDFYKRTLAKKEEIIEYLLKGILNRAIEKSAPGEKRNWGPALRDMQVEMEKHDDFPYMELQYGESYRYAISMDKLDYRKINPLINKLGWLGRSHHAIGKYTPAINKEFKSKIKTDYFFQQTIEKLERLPIIRERLKMFQEMEFMFQNQKWYALYSLALPQVEGIFSEMLEMHPDKKRSASLTDKVNNLRPFYQMGSYTFDYYQYTLADLRNSFSHTGKVNNPETQCYHLLLDIRYLLDMGLELDAPLSKISKQIDEGSGSIKHIGDLNEFLELLQKIDKDKKLPAIKAQAEDFIYKNLLKDIDMKQLLARLEKDIETSLKSLIQNSAMLLYEKGKPDIDIFTCSTKDIKFNCQRIEKAFDKIPMFVTEDFKMLLDVNNFLHYFPAYFPKIRKKIKTNMEKLLHKYAEELKRIFLINKECKLDLEASYILLPGKLTHKLP